MGEFFIKNGVLKEYFTILIRDKIIEIPTDVKVIGDGAFNQLSMIERIISPDSVVEIEEEAFLYLRSLKSFYLPKSVIKMGEGAISYCSSIKSIEVDKDNPRFDSRNNCNAIIDSKKNELLLGCVNTVIPKDVKRIGVLAFSCVHGFKHFVIPDNIQTIGHQAFYSCYSMESIMIPKSVKRIGVGAFDGIDHNFDIFYAGTKKDWDKIDKAKLYEPDIFEDESIVLHCIDGDFDIKY